MFQMFYPDEYVKSAYSIDYKALYNKGFRGIIFDIDNTLTEHGKDAPPKAIALFERLHKLGFKTCLLSNNKEERVRRFNREIGSSYIFNAHKPSVKSYEKAMELMGTSKTDTLFIGDQLFTDVWGAKRTGIHNILTEPIDKKEEIQIVLKRYLEKAVLCQYKKQG